MKSVSLFKKAKQTEVIAYSRHQQHTRSEILPKNSLHVYLVHKPNFLDCKLHLFELLI